MSSNDQLMLSTASKVLYSQGLTKGQLLNYADPARHSAHQQLHWRNSIGSKRGRESYGLEGEDGRQIYGKRERERGSDVTMESPAALSQGELYSIRTLTQCSVIVEPLSDCPFWSTLNFAECSETALSLGIAQSVCSQTCSDQLRTTSRCDYSPSVISWWTLQV